MKSFVVMRRCLYNLHTIYLIIYNYVRNNIIAHLPSKSFCPAIQGLALFEESVVYRRDVESAMVNVDKVLFLDHKDRQEWLQEDHMSRGHFMVFAPFTFNARSLVVRGISLLLGFCVCL